MSDQKARRFTLVRLLSVISQGWGNRLMRCLRLAMVYILDEVGYDLHREGNDSSV